MAASRSTDSRYTAAILTLCVLLCVGLGCKVKPDSEWKSQLGGKRLSRANNSGAVSSKLDIYFCSNGEYALQSQFSGFSTGGAGTLSMADEDIEYGRWTVEHSTLILRSQNGKTHEYEIFQGKTTHDECE
jgi:hypothetical protein